MIFQWEIGSEVFIHIADACPSPDAETSSEKLVCTKRKFIKLNFFVDFLNLQSKTENVFGGG